MAAVVVVTEAHWDLCHNIACEERVKWARNQNITSAIVADDVRRLLGNIGKYSPGRDTGVFQQCSNLKKVKLPDSLKMIGKNTFYACRSLTRITIPSGVTYIGIAAFAHCSALKTITIPDGVIELEDDAFLGCKSLESVKLPSSLEKIGARAFSECESLIAIYYEAIYYEGRNTKRSVCHLPPNLASIGDHAFKGCRNLPEIDIDDNNKLEHISTTAFVSTKQGFGFAGICNSQFRYCKKLRGSLQKAAEELEQAKVAAAKELEQAKEAAEKELEQAKEAAEEELKNVRAKAWEELEKIKKEANAEIEEAKTKIAETLAGLAESEKRQIKEGEKRLRLIEERKSSMGGESVENPEKRRRITSSPSTLQCVLRTSRE